MANTDYYPGWGDESMKLYLKKLDIYKKEGLQMLQKFCAKTNNANINTEFIQKVGSLGSIICNLAKEWNADLIIMGLQGLFGITELLIGSLSNYVLHNASYSVYTIYLVITVKSAK